MTRLAIFTSQDVGPTLIEFIASRGDVAPLVITTDGSRDALYGYRSTIEAAHKAGVECIVSSTVTAPVATRIREFQPDMILCAYYSARLPRDILALCPAVNVHPGILPRYKGKFPTPWYILNGEPEFGIAVHEMTEAIDGGAVLIQKTFPIAPDETGHGLLKRTMDESARTLIENFDALINRTLTPLPQLGEESTFSFVDRRVQIDWNWPAETMSRQVRVHAKPYFPAYSFLSNSMVLFNAMKIGKPAEAVPGTILAVSPLVVMAGDRAVEFIDYEVAPALKPAELAVLFQAGNRFEQV